MTLAKDCSISENQSSLTPLIQEGCHSARSRRNHIRSCLHLLDPATACRMTGVVWVCRVTLFSVIPTKPINHTPVIPTERINHIPVIPTEPKRVEESRLHRHKINRV